MTSSTAEKPQRKLSYFGHLVSKCVNCKTYFGHKNIELLFETTKKFMPWSTLYCKYNNEENEQMVMILNSIDFK